jgi:hypothetical protein
MEAARTSETSDNSYLTTWQYIPEDSELHTRRRENLKSHKFQNVLIIGLINFFVKMIVEDGSKN